jgi:MFS family permease
MKLSDLKKSGHWPTLLTSFLYFDVSFMVWTILGALGAQIGKSLALTPQDKGTMVAVPILAGAAMRVVLGFAVDRFGGKPTGIVAQTIVALGLLSAYQCYSELVFGLTHPKSAPWNAQGGPLLERNPLLFYRTGFWVLLALTLLLLCLILCRH